MALIFSPYTFGSDGIMNTFGPGGGTNSLFYRVSRIFIYPSTVAYPSSVPTTVPLSPILTFVVSRTDFQEANGTINLIGSKVAVASAGGTLDWWLLTFETTPGGNIAAGNYGSMISNSITTSGNGGVLIISTLTPALNESVSMTTFNLTLGPQ